MEHAAEYARSLQTWTQQQSSFVLAQYSQMGWTPRPQQHLNPSIVPLAAEFPRVAQMTPTPCSGEACRRFHGLPRSSHEASGMIIQQGYGIPGGTYGPPNLPNPRIPQRRSDSQNVQLTVALQLYLVTTPGIIFDDYTIAQIVHGVPYGTAWVAPATALLSNLNEHPDRILRSLYQEVIRNRVIWATRAFGAYAEWTRLCRWYGIVPPPAYRAQWW